MVTGLKPVRDAGAGSRMARTLGNVRLTLSAVNRNLKGIFNFRLRIQDGLFFIQNASLQVSKNEGDQQSPRSTPTG